MYSGKFNEAHSDVDYDILREFKLEFPIENINTELFFINIFNNPDSGADIPFDIMIELSHLFNFLMIDWNVISGSFYYKISKEYNHEIINPLKSLNSYSNMILSDHEKDIFLYIYSNNIDNTDDISVLFPGYYDRLDEIELILKSINLSTGHLFIGNTLRYILTGENILPNIISVNLYPGIEIDIYNDTINTCRSIRYVKQDNDICEFCIYIDNYIIYITYNEYFCSSEGLYINGMYSLNKDISNSYKHVFNTPSNNIKYDSGSPIHEHCIIMLNNILQVVQKPKSYLCAYSSSDKTYIVDIFLL